MVQEKLKNWFFLLSSIRIKPKKIGEKRDIRWKFILLFVAFILWLRYVLCLDADLVSGLQTLAIIWVIQQHEAYQTATRRHKQKD